MNARLAFAAVAVGLLLAVHDARARVPADADFMPLRVGARWAFVSNDGHETDETVSGAVPIRAASGATAMAATIASASGGEFFYLRTEKGVMRFYDPPSAALPDPDRVTWVLRFPLHHGSHWESWTPAGRVEFRVTDRRGVTAPDGSLTDGVRVDFVSLPEPIFSGHIWYARGIGPIEVVEGDYSRKLLGYRAGDGQEIPIAKRLAELEPPSLAERWRMGQKGWVALVLIAAAATGVALLPRLKRPLRPGAWEKAAGAENVPPEDDGSLAVQAAQLEASVAAHPTYADLRCKLGLVYAEMERHEDAIAQFTSALELNPRYVEAGLGRTRALQRAARPLEAVESIRPFAERHPSYADVQNLLGEALAESGQLLEAHAAFRRALEINPRYEAARRNVEKWALPKPSDGAAGA